MKLWIGIVCGIFIGFIIGIGTSSNIWYETFWDCMKLNDELITELYESKDYCDERVSNCMDKCDELIEDYQEIIEKWKYNYDDLHSDWQEALVTLANCYENSLPKCNYLVPQVKE